MDNPASERKSESDDEGVEVQRRTKEVQKPPAKGSILLVCGLVMGGAAILAVVLGGMKDNSTYSKGVDDLIREKARFTGRAVSAEGNLVHGTLVKRNDPCEYRFTIEKNGVQVPVRFAQCVAPDTFRDMPGDVGVTVVGKLLADNSFEATSIVAKCPSKYEMKERKQNGELMPHAPPGQSAPM
jgi:cytochrome c-type biogenesis protein CcmE